MSTHPIVVEIGRVSGGKQPVIALLRDPNPTAECFCFCRFRKSSPFTLHNLRWGQVVVGSHKTKLHGRKHQTSQKLGANFKL